MTSDLGDCPSCGKALILGTCTLCGVPDPELVAKRKAEKKRPNGLGNCKICGKPKTQNRYPSGNLEQKYKARKRMTCGDPECLSQVRTGKAGALGSQRPIREALIERNGAEWVRKFGKALGIDG